MYPRTPVYPNIGLPPRVARCGCHSTSGSHSASTPSMSPRFRASYIRLATATLSGDIVHSISPRAHSWLPCQGRATARGARSRHGREGRDERTAECSLARRGALRGLAVALFVWLTVILATKAGGDVR